MKCQLDRRILCVLALLLLLYIQLYIWKESIFVSAAGRFLGVGFKQNIIDLYINYFERVTFF